MYLYFLTVRLEADLTFIFLKGEFIQNENYPTDKEAIIILQMGYTNHSWAPTMRNFFNFDTENQQWTPDNRNKRSQ